MSFAVGTLRHLIEWLVSRCYREELLVPEALLDECFDLFHLASDFPGVESFSRIWTGNTSKRSVSTLSVARSPQACLAKFFRLIQKVLKSFLGSVTHKEFPFQFGGCFELDFGDFPAVVVTDNVHFCA